MLLAVAVFRIRMGRDLHNRSACVSRPMSRRPVKRATNISAFFLVRCRPHGQDAIAYGRDSTLTEEERAHAFYLDRHFLAWY
jgi:hypothetical protein